MGNSPSEMADNGTPLEITSALPAGNVLSGWSGSTSDSGMGSSLPSLFGGNYTTKTVTSPNVQGPKNATNIPNVYQNQYFNAPKRPPTKLYRNRYPASSPFRPYYNQ